MPTIRSRCQHVRFDPRPVDEISREIAQTGVAEATAIACARLALGDGARARELASEPGAMLRAAAEGCARAAGSGRTSGSEPWTALLGAVRAAGELVAAEIQEAKAAEVDVLPARERKRAEAAWADRTKRVRRRTETATLDLGLQLVSLWFVDLAALAWGAADLVRNVDRLDVLAGDRDGLGADPLRLRRGVELVEDTRRRFALNVSEDLACEALAFRLERLLAA